MKRTHPLHPPADTAFSPGLRRLGWLNIAVQTAFTPVMAGAGLRELNQLRTFAHGLNGLRPGNDVDVPLMTAKASGAPTASSFH